MRIAAEEERDALCETREDEAIVREIVVAEQQDRVGLKGFDTTYEFGIVEPADGAWAGAFGAIGNELMIVAFEQRDVPFDRAAKAGVPLPCPVPEVENAQGQLERGEGRTERGTCEFGLSLLSPLSPLLREEPEPGGVVLDRVGGNDGEAHGEKQKAEIRKQ